MTMTTVRSAKPLGTGKVTMTDVRMPALQGPS